MIKEKVLTAEQAIVKHLKDNGQMLLWLSGKIDISVGHLHSVLKGNKKVKRELTQENLDKINAALGTDFKK